MRTLKWRVAVVALSILLIAGQGTWVLAGTTGTLGGTIVDASTKAPVSGARVSALSPSQSVSVTSDAEGRFTFLSLAPDTYTVQVERAGYEGATISGVTVFADQRQTLALTVNPSLRQIGHTTSRAAGDLVKAGQTADVYSVNAAQAEAASALGGGGSLNQAYSAIASVPGVFLPQGQQGWAQAVFVRGGNYTQLGYEYDGVPVQRAYDAYPSGTLSSLGQQELQVYTGSQPGSAQSSGLAGFINQVIKTGTYPGTATATGGLGAPVFYHKGQLELGGASPNRNFSYYVAAGGYDQAFRPIDQFDGEAYQNAYGVWPYAIVRSGCGTANATAGCYNTFTGPNGFVYAPITYGLDSFIADRESVANLHFGLPHPHDGLKDDVQVLGQISLLSLGYDDAFNSYGPGATAFFRSGVANYQGISYPTCTGALIGANTPCVFNALNIFGGSVVPGGFRYNDRSIYTGPTGGPLTAANLSQVSQYAFPGQPGGLPLHGYVDPNTPGTQKIDDGIFKLQYTHAMGANAFVRVYGYSLYSDWLNNDPNGSSNPFAFTPNDYILPTHTRGIGLTVADQLGNHLLNLTGGYTYARTSRWNNSFPSSANPVAVLVDSTHPTSGTCYDGTGAGMYCNGGAEAYYSVPGTNQPATNGLQAHNNGAITVANAGTFTCGSGPCEFLSLGSGLNGSFNDVTPRFSNLTLGDSWRATPKLTLDAAVRYDSFRYDLPSANVPEGPNPGNASALGRTLFTNSFNQYYCFNPQTDFHPLLNPSGIPGSCAAGSAVAFTNATPAAVWYGGFQPRVGATYQLGTQDVLRAGYGRYLQPTSSAYLFYNRAGADVASYDAANFYSFGFTSPAHNIPPSESYNFDFSWEHQVRNSDLSWKVTPFARRTRNEAINIILDPITLFSSMLDDLSEDVKGVELAVRKGDFSRNGFAAQLSYTYTSATARYQALPNGSTALANVNLAVRQYNGYTSYCSTHPSDKRCGSPTNGVPAAPCYAADGTPDTGCAAGSIANPYWNAPVQSLFDPNASYAPYNQTFGVGPGSNVASYVVPHVASLIMNYKHDRWNLTPSLQFSAGARYGSPVSSIGIDPAAGCSVLAGAAVAGDPRYPYGAAGGAPFDAQTCNATLTAPSAFTHKFDNLGAFVEPSQIVANLGLGFDASKRVRLSLLATNLFGTCFGGTKQAWTNAGPRVGCFYGPGDFVVGNSYNPGNALQNQAYPYFPVTGGIAGQQVYGTSANPLQLTFSAQVKI